ncbi:uncharacterized protein LY89DRAFT_611898 [Mollisia scopiformis]|uniref:guanylate kinase n=1 Tax=Mollisia scopiformis TaxID=149040 RepID=A0A194XJJ1_MOLSC|nr:uncharacterized protein LY89DRAFT_611898 [Mollisia scopiformis]KUJ19932.1 hypothetical protein LY89DRAFT_611898 [Mollisia scopiformis]
MATMAGHGVEAVDEFGSLMEEMLDKAQEVKQTDTVDPPLNKSDLADSFEEILSIFSPTTSADFKKHVIETAIRPIFYNLLATTSIDSPSFVRLWNLFDIISILSDDEHTESGLLFWLVEELLDSQTIAGCRKIFDFLESRRERITAKHFQSKNLVILRSCNELLRRLSRAEDTAFCGRVFIFLFQSFPLGDRSSVNLRGEYHTENVTAFEQLPPKEAATMEVDSDTSLKPPAPVAKIANGASKKSSEDFTTGAKGVTFQKVEKPMASDELYPIFWALQQNFSQPKRLFDSKHPENFADFKSGLEATMAVFKSVQAENSGRPSKVIDESKRGTKRKRGLGDDDLANAFNPKYLTSPDLFELEISDLSFRRHILVQVLIIMEFLLSLSARAKAKLARASLPDNANKSVMYADWTLSEDDTKWAIETKSSVADYLKQGYEGPFYHRMIETVLSRDKNWARWKVENCPSIARPAIAPDDYASAKASARRTTNKRVKLNSLGSLDLKFLRESDNRSNIDRLKDSSRYAVPSVKTYEAGILDDDFDIDRAQGEEAKQAPIEAKASKSWRALRIATGSKLVAFDKIESSEKIDDIFKDDPKPEEPVINNEEESEAMDTNIAPTDRRPIIISGPSGVGKGTMVNMLMDKHPKAFGKKASHTIRAPREGEVHGQHYYFITKEEFDIMRDGDQFLEYNNFNGNDYGTSRKVVEAIIAQGKVPVLEMDYHGIQQLKDQGYASRFIFLAPPDIPTLEERLKRRGLDDSEKIKQRLEIALKEIEQSQVEGFQDKIIINDDIGATYKALEDYIFGHEGSDQVATVEEVTSIEDNGENGHSAPAVTEIVTEDAAE